MKILNLLFFNLMSLLCVAGYAEPNLRLSSYDLPPYIGQNLNNQGALYEIVTAAFAQAERRVEIDFFPTTRAINFALIGEYQAVFPVTYDAVMSGKFLVSEPIASYQLGLLGKKSIEASGAKISEATTIAVLRGSISEQAKIAFAPAKFLYVSRNEQAMKMLYAGRVNYVLIDKFNAADLMVDQFPYMIGQFTFPKQFIESIDLYVAFSKKSAQAQENLASFNSALKQLKAQGVIDSLMNRHGLLLFEQSAEHKVLRIATVANGDMVLMQRLSREYEQLHPAIRLDWRVLDESILRRRLLSDLAIGEGQYDVMTIGSYEVPVWDKQNWLSPLTDLPEDYDQADLIDVIRDSLSYNGELYALPFYGESSMTYYRRDLFDRAGLTMPAEPTWEQIRTFAATLHAPDEGIYGLCLRGKVGWGENITNIGTLVNTFGGQWFDLQWVPQLDTPAWHQAVNVYVDLVQSFGPPDTYKNGFSENLKLFAEGHCALWVDATVAAGLLFDAGRSTVADTVWFAPAPVALTPKGSAWLWAWSLAIPSSSKLQAEAKDFIAWATSKDYINRVAEYEGWLAVPPGTRKSTYANKNYRQAAPFADYVFDAINSANPRDATLTANPYTGIQFVAVPEFTAIGNFVSQSINAVLQGKLTVDQALAKSQAFTLDVMKNAGAAQ